MISRDQLTSFITKTMGDDLLAAAAQKDEMANGVQFLGGEKVSKVTLGVSLNQDFLDEAITAKSNFCIFHHGFDPRTYKSRYSLSSQSRLQTIFKNHLTVIGLHYSLDAHPTIGNNAVIIKNLGAKITGPLFDDWGFTAKLSTPQQVTKLAKQCSQLFAHDVFAIYTGPKKVTTIGVVSGGAKPYAAEMAEMEQKGVELFITGETSEAIPHKMKESSINYFAGGHYATEVFGIQELGKKIKAHFKNKLEVEFIDIPNPI